MAAKVAFSEQALDDLLSIYVYLAEATGLTIADRHESRIRAACSSLAHFPNRGTPHEDLSPGLRNIPFKRSATIYYRVVGRVVEIVRILPRGVEAKKAFDFD